MHVSLRLRRIAATVLFKRFDCTLRLLIFKPPADKTYTSKAWSIDTW